MPTPHYARVPQRAPAAQQATDDTESASLVSSHARSPPVMERSPLGHVTTSTDVDVPMSPAAASVSRTSTHNSELQSLMSSQRTGEKGLPGVPMAPSRQQSGSFSAPLQPGRSVQPSGGRSWVQIANVTGQDSAEHVALPVEWLAAAARVSRTHSEATVIAEMTAVAAAPDDLGGGHSLPPRPASAVGALLSSELSHIAMPASSYASPGVVLTPATLVTHASAPGCSPVGRTPDEQALSINLAVTEALMSAAARRATSPLDQSISLCMQSPMSPGGSVVSRGSGLDSLAWLRSRPGGQKPVDSTVLSSNAASLRMELGRVDEGGAQLRMRQEGLPVLQRVESDPFLDAAPDPFLDRVLEDASQGDVDDGPVRDVSGESSEASAFGGAHERTVWSTDRAGPSELPQGGPPVASGWADVGGRSAGWGSELEEASELAPSSPSRFGSPGGHRSGNSGTSDPFLDG
jgi:hypothetical protein